MDGVWDWFWLMFWFFVFTMYLVVLFQILGDLFRDKSTSGWAKAAWVILLVVVPYLTAVIYIIARGRGMAERRVEDMTKAKAETDAYIQQVAGSSPAEDITRAKALLDSGAIDAEEFAVLKARALG